MSDIGTGPIGQTSDTAAENSEPDAAPATPETPDSANPADTEHPVGEEQAQRNIEQEPPG